MEYEAVIGLEVHVQAKTLSKMFCGCSTEFGNKPNSNTCPLCTAQPGVLPVLNKRAVELAITAGLALGCKINERSIFARKNYYYPDLPKSYQISQYDQPICGKGSIEVTLEDGTRKKIGITRVHMEEDAGKLVHQGAEGIAGAHSSFVDLNRAGVPLLEIVSEPDMRTPAEAKAYLEKIKSILQYAGVSDANMEEGKLRCDANVSIRPVGQKELGTKTEVKNMNSFKGVERALKAEIKRQLAMVKKGERIVQETRNFIEDTGETTSMRSKEEAHDYRYFPEPDLVPVVVSKEWTEEIRKTLPEMPEEMKKRYVNQYHIPEYNAEVITNTGAVLAKYYDETVKRLGIEKAVSVSNWYIGAMSGFLNDTKKRIEDTGLLPDRIAELHTAVENGQVSASSAKEELLPFIANMPLDAEFNLSKIIEEKGLAQISNESEIEEIVKRIIKENPKQVTQYKAGKTAVLGFFVGQVMKATQGKAKPEMVNNLLREKLG